MRFVLPWVVEVGSHRKIRFVGRFFKSMAWVYRVYALERRLPSHLGRPLLKKAEGQPSKYHFEFNKGTRKGDAMITRYGMEGTPFILWVSVARFSSI